ncbi:MAG TPA: hypothetical protein VGP42_15085 [Stellaceae bacterium]|nr:hypothetical protein [Stellaceae bacterium]
MPLSPSYTRCCVFVTVNRTRDKAGETVAPPNQWARSLFFDAVNLRAARSLRGAGVLGFLPCGCGGVLNARFKTTGHSTRDLFAGQFVLLSLMIGLDETAIWDLMNGLRTEPVQIGWLHPGYKRAIGASTPIVWLSSYTIDHVALGRHRQGYYETLCLTPDIIRTGHCRQIGPDRLAFVYAKFEAPNKPYRAVVKVAAKGTEVYLESVYRIQAAQVRTTLLRNPAVSKY